MGTRDPRIDAYIARSADFAKPILMSIRETVHSACPDMQETMKWSTPHFTYHGILCGMAAFRQHCAFGFWKGSLILDEGDRPAEKGAGQFGRLTRVSDLPPRKTLAGYIRKAMRLNEEGVQPPARQKAGTKTRTAVAVPADLAAALAKDPRARATFEAFSPSHKREYTEWITDAKREETRQRRIETAITEMAEGKSRNWKYQRTSSG